MIIVEGERGGREAEDEAREISTPLETPVEAFLTICQKKK